MFCKATNGTTTVAVTFNGANGALPHGSLTANPAGTLFGTTLAGGSFGFGTIFSYTSRGVFTTLFNFKGCNGSDPHGGVLLDSRGTLFGSTAFGGTKNLGTVFKLQKKAARS